MTNNTAANGVFHIGNGQLSIGGAGQITGTSSPSNLQLTTGTLAFAGFSSITGTIAASNVAAPTFTQGANMTITGTWPNLTFAASGGGGSSGYVTKTANYTAVAGDKIIADTTGGSFTISLPASPAVGSVVTILDGGNSGWGGSPIVIDRNGELINAAPSNITVGVSNLQLTFIFAGGGWGWKENFQIPRDRIDFSQNYFQGNLSPGFLNSGTGADTTTFWRGDGVWAVPPGSGATYYAVVDQAARFAGTYHNGDFVREVGANQVEYIACTGDSGGSLNSTWFSVYDTNGTEYQIWFNIDGGGTSPGGRTPSKSIAPAMTVLMPSRTMYSMRCRGMAPSTPPSIPHGIIAPTSR